MRLGTGYSRWLIDGWAIFVAASTLLLAAAAATGALLGGVPLIGVPVAAIGLWWLRYGFTVAVRVRAGEVLMVAPLRRVTVDALQLQTVDVRYPLIELVPVQVLAVKRKSRAPALVRTRGWSDDAALIESIADLVAAAGPRVLADGRAAEVRAALRSPRGAG